MIDIPHLPPIRFAQSVVEKRGEDCIVVECKFPQQPTIGELIEASAQASAGFGVQEGQNGFLVQVRDVEILKPIEHTTLFTQISLKVDIGAMTQFEFSFFSENNLQSQPLAKGGFTIFKQ